MSEAPEKIWTTGNAEQTTGSWNADKIALRLSPNQTPYTRTDLAAQQALDAERRGYERGVRDVERMLTAHIRASELLLGSGITPETNTILGRHLKEIRADALALLSQNTGGE